MAKKPSLAALKNFINNMKKSSKPLQKEGVMSADAKNQKMQTGGKQNLLGLFIRMRNSKTNDKALESVKGLIKIGKQSKRNRRIAMYASIVFAAAVILIIVLNPFGSNTASDTMGINNQIALSGQNQASVLGDFSGTESPTSPALITITPEATPEPSLAPTTEPTVKPTATPAPSVDVDKLVEYYMVEADKYYSDYYYSTNHYDYTDEELRMLAQLIYGEARGESLKGKIAVANVVMNRVLASGYPGDTIKEVVTANNQFSGYNPDRKPNSACIYAARQVLDKEVWVIPQDVYFFNSSMKAGENWGGHQFYIKIGGHCFYTEDYSGRRRDAGIPPALFERVFKWPQYGCKPGKRVSRIQYMLNKLKYDVKADGYYGLTTKIAIAEFQKKKGLDADGVAGPSTIKALIIEFGLDKYLAKYKA